TTRPSSALPSRATRTSSAARSSPGTTRLAARAWSARYVWNDANGNHNVDPGELGAFIQDLGGFNHLQPNAIGSANVIDPNLKAPLTDEFQLSFAREILPEFTASLTGTYRHRHRIIWSPYIGATAASYNKVFATGLPGYDVNGNQVGVTGPIYTG